MKAQKSMQECKKQKKWRIKNYGSQVRYWKTNLITKNSSKGNDVSYVLCWKVWRQETLVV